MRLLVALTVASTACGGAPSSDPADPAPSDVAAPDDAPPAETGARQLEPEEAPQPADDGPYETQDVLEQHLLFLDATGDEVRDVVAPYDGQIDLEVPEIQMVQVRFPVGSRTELVELRDELRDGGYNVTLVLTTEPGLEDSPVGPP